MWWNNGMHRSQEWLRYFRRNAASPRTIPWDHSYRLSPAERRVIASSIRQFQLGEGSTGTRLLEKARAWVDPETDPHFVETVAAFVREEQRHSAELGRFLAIEGIEPLRFHWLDACFRVLRRLGGLELELRVLTTAEIVAMVYYRSLMSVTNSPILRELCRLFLRDEAAHLRFHAANMGRFASRMPRIKRWLHLCFLVGTGCTVYLSHRGVLRADGFHWFTFVAALLDMEARRAEVSAADTMAIGS